MPLVRRQLARVLLRLVPWPMLGARVLRLVLAQGAPKVVERRAVPIHRERWQQEGEQRQRVEARRRLVHHQRQRAHRE